MIIDHNCRSLHDWRGCDPGCPVVKTYYRFRFALPLLLKKGRKLERCLSQDNLYDTNMCPIYGLQVTNHNGSSSNYNNSSGSIIDI